LDASNCGASVTLTGRCTLLVLCAVVGADYIAKDIFRSMEFGIWNLEFIKTLDAKEPRALLT
jgi:hypothetical protein